MRADLKELLFEAYESGRLIACVAFVAKVLEGIPESRIFKPPNPWTMGLLNAMRELYDVAEIKLNLRFEVEVRFCKCICVAVAFAFSNSRMAVCFIHAHACMCAIAVDVQATVHRCERLDAWSTVVRAQAAGVGWQPGLQRKGA